MDNEGERDEHLLIFSAQLNGSVFIAFTSKALSMRGPGAAGAQVTNNNTILPRRRQQQKNTHTHTHRHIAYALG